MWFRWSLVLRRIRGAEERGEAPSRAWGRVAGGNTAASAVSPFETAALPLQSLMSAR